MNNTEAVKRMTDHKEEWLGAMGDKAVVRTPSYGAVVHGVSTRMEVSNITEMEDMIHWNNPSLENAKMSFILSFIVSAVASRASLVGAGRVSAQWDERARRRMLGQEC
ncbi:hypothetical protein CIHG_04406 [Coccidioides immitis H538.4]|uniref:Uncharacterized protein n=3 Tax=Coccidioides immitis TaxID=5501 RepID=A0A0J8R4S6_COCIT|nr:hypothetical protein CIRG_09339 [Coccidioides immitis RMSCC 2394]KMU80089.1 hypothetical protein CISG_08431 [Coccidioides immitis RMSCC 3703]KMU86618.1 hypothetical protein CIHG_04406 [Coccidioides immitis H538.4]